MTELEICRDNVRRLLVLKAPDESARDRILREVWAIENGSGQSRATLARSLGICPPNLSSYLNASKGYPQPAVARKLRKYGVSACPCGWVTCEGRHE